MGTDKKSSRAFAREGLRECLYHCAGDDGHFVDLVGVAATGQVVNGSSQTLQNGAVSLETAQALSDLVTDVTGLDGGEDKGVSVAGNRGETRKRGLTWDFLICL